MFDLGALDGTSRRSEINRLRLADERLKLRGRNAAGAPGLGAVQQIPGAQLRRLATVGPAEHLGQLLGALHPVDRREVSVTDSRASMGASGATGTDPDMTVVDACRHLFELCSGRRDALAAGCFELKPVPRADQRAAVHCAFRQVGTEMRARRRSHMLFGD